MCVCVCNCPLKRTPPDRSAGTRHGSFVQLVQRLVVAEVRVFRHGLGPQAAARYEHAAAAFADQQQQECRSGAHEPHETETVRQRLGTEDVAAETRDQRREERAAGAREEMGQLPPAGVLPARHDSQQPRDWPPVAQHTLEEHRPPAR